MAAAAILSTTPYQLDISRSNVHRWSTSQEKSIATTYPLEYMEGYTASDLEAHLRRTYLQFLWLPESLMPLALLLPCLQQVSSAPGTAPGSSEPHPMHALLENFISTTRIVYDKYHDVLSQILEHGGGEGEMEEMMMWYVVEHEKVPEGISAENGIWTNEKWRKEYLERMEKREVEVQILLYLYKLSLPGPLPKSKSKKTKLKRLKRGSERLQADQTEPTLEEHLESFMDKLAMWQLLKDLSDEPKPKTTAKPTTQSSKGKGKSVDERDWTQVFVEDVVEPLFKSTLPQQCALLRSKVFPNSHLDTQDGGDTDTEPMDELPTSKHLRKKASLAADDFQETFTDTTVMVPTGVPLKRALSRAPSQSSNTVASTRARSRSRAPSVSRTSSVPSPTHSTISTTSRSTLNRTRSQSISLSESLAREEREKRDRLIYGDPQEDMKGKKRVINREVSMSRSFKRSKSKAGLDGTVATAVKEKALEKEQEKEKLKEKELGVTLVEETPAKPRIAPTARNRRPSEGQSQARLPSLNFGVTSILADGGRLSLGGDGSKSSIRSSPKSSEMDEDEEEWLMDSSPDIQLFNPASSSSEGTKVTEDEKMVSDDEGPEEWDKEDAAMTPCKPRPKRLAAKRQ